jgi:PAS domain S-box-containing protein
MFLARLKIADRLLLIVFGTIIGIVAVGGYSLFEIRTNLFEDRKTKTQHVVQIAEGLIAHYYGQEASGAITRDEAQSAAVTVIEKLRYAENDYFWIQTYDNILVIHPFQPELNNTDLTGYEDPNGVKLFDEMIDVVKKDGAGFVEYSWPRPGSEKPVPKVSFVKGFAPWKWAIGSGIYVDDVNAIYQQVLLVVGMVALSILVVVVGASTVISRGITKPLSSIAGNMRRLVEGDRDIEVQFTDQNNEIGDLSRMMDVFIEKTIEMDRLREEQRKAEKRFKGLFDHAEVSIWNLDLSKTHEALEKLRLDGITDLRRYLENNESAVWDINATVKVVQVNEATLKLFGANSEDEFLNQIEKIFGPSVTELFIDEVCAIWEKKNNFRSEENFHTLDGKDINAIISFRIPETEDDFRSVPVSLIDITERQRSELALKESERRLDLALRSTEDGIWDWIAENDELFLSPRWKQMLGFEDEEIQSGDDPFPKLVHPDEKERVQRALKEFFASPESRYETEMRLLHKDGHYITVQATAFAERDDTGRVTRFTGRHTDVTKIRETEAQLLQAQKMEAVGQLTGGVAHNFNNILAVIMTNAEILADDVEGESHNAPVTDAIIRAVYRGSALTRRLLAFSRRSELMSTRVDVSAAVMDMKEMLQRTLGETITVRINAEPGLPLVVLDQNQFENGVLNLSVNARDAMPSGGSLAINVAAEEPFSKGSAMGAGESLGYVCVRISDSGSGIPASVAERIFEPFFTTKKMGDGTGLGLSMVYGFVKQSGGEITVESEDGKGTTFRMYFPFDLANATTDEVGGSSPEKARSVAGGESSPSLKILLVEDDEHLRDSIRKILQGEGHRVVEAADGHVALRRLTQNPDTDLLFSDVIMPGHFSGRDLAAAAVKVKPDLKILFTSGYAAGRLTKTELREFKAGFLSKPYSKSDLVDAICALVGGKGKNPIVDTGRWIT